MEKHIGWVKDALARDPFDVESRRTLLRLLGEAGNAVALEEARREWSEICALPEIEWLEWLKPRLTTWTEEVSDVPCEGEKTKKRKKKTQKKSNVSLL
jgi:hypothetical protein